MVSKIDTNKGYLVISAVVMTLTLVLLYFLTSFVKLRKSSENFSLISRQDLLKIDPDSIRKTPEFSPKPLFSKIKSINF